MRAQKSDWLPKAIIVDCCDAEIAAVEYAFDGKVDALLCHWHWQRALKKQLYNKVTLACHLRYALPVTLFQISQKKFQWKMITPSANVCRSVKSMWSPCLWTFCA